MKRVLGALLLVGMIGSWGLQAAQTPETTVVTFKDSTVVDYPIDNLTLFKTLRTVLMTNNCAASQLSVPCTQQQFEVLVRIAQGNPVPTIQDYKTLVHLFNFAILFDNQTAVDALAQAVFLRLLRLKDICLQLTLGSPRFMMLKYMQAVNKNMFAVLLNSINRTLIESDIDDMQERQAIVHTVDLLTQFAMNDEQYTKTLQDSCGQQKSWTDRLKSWWQGK